MGLHARTFGWRGATVGENEQPEGEDAESWAPRLRFPRVSEGSTSCAFPLTGTGYLQLTSAGAHFLGGAFNGSRAHVRAPLFWEPPPAAHAAALVSCAVKGDRRRVSGAGIDGSPAAFGSPKSYFAARKRGRLVASGASPDFTVALKERIFRPPKRRGR